MHLYLSMFVSSGNFVVLKSLWKSNKSFNNITLVLWWISLWHMILCILLRKKIDGNYVGTDCISLWLWACDALIIWLFDWQKNIVLSVSDDITMHLPITQCSNAFIIAAQQPPSVQREARKRFYMQQHRMIFDMHH